MQWDHAMIRTLRALVLVVAVPLALAGCGKDSTTAGPAAGKQAAALAPIAAPAGKAWSDVVAVTADGGYRMGNPQAPIKLVEFASLTCPHCAEFAGKAFAPLRDKYVASGRVSFELRNFIRDPIDLTAAMLTRCGRPESFFALTEQVFANQPAIFEKVQAGQAKAEAAQSLPDDKKFVTMGQVLGLTDFFAARGISNDQAAACLAKGQTAAQLAQATQTQGRQYAIQGTPTFLIDGSNVNVSTWEELEPLLQARGAR
jgi:protein-disulfide isomerase